jgi:hypothetical protein
MAVNYTLVDPGNKGFHEDHWAVQILEGDLEGYMFQYDSVRIIEQENPEDGAVLEFNTVTLKEVDADLTNEEKKNILGDILVDILMEQIENADGTPNPEQPTE